MSALAGALALLLAHVALGADLIPVPPTDPAGKPLPADFFELSHAVEGDFLRLRVTCDSGEWVAVGLSPKEVMEDAKILLGYLDPAGKPIVLDEYGDTRFSHKPSDSVGGVNQLVPDPRNAQDPRALTPPTVKRDSATGAITLELVYPLDSHALDPKTGKTLKPGAAVENGLILACGKLGTNGLPRRHNKTARRYVKTLGQAWRAAPPASH